MTGFSFAPAVPRDHQLGGVWLLSLRADFAGKRCARRPGLLCTVTCATPAPLPALRAYGIFLSGSGAVSRLPAPPPPLEFLLPCTPPTRAQKVDCAALMTTLTNARLLGRQAAGGMPRARSPHVVAAHVHVAGSGLLAWSPSGRRCWRRGSIEQCSDRWSCACGGCSCSAACRVRSRCSPGVLRAWAPCRAVFRLWHRYHSGFASIWWQLARAVLHACAV
jgi:hypothetical protein